MLTNYSLEIKEYINNLKYEENDWLNKEQRLIHDVFVNKIKRGLLAYWKPGSGKTHLTAACALTLERPVLWITNKSLTADTNAKLLQIKEQMEARGLDPTKLKEFKFLSLNAGNLKKQADAITFDGTFDGHFIVVDEAHHFFNSISNNSKNATDLYLKIKNSKNIKILFLTGTPIVKNLFEMVPCFNMLAGYELLPENIDDFESLFFKEDKLININKLENRLMGLISFYELPPDEAKKRLPKELPEVFHKIEMSPFQYAKYVIAREKEIEETSKERKKAKIGTFIKNDSSSTYRVASRQICNFAPPDHAYEIQADSKLHFNPDLLTDEDCKQLHKYSPKIERWLKDVQEEDCLQTTFSRFKPFGINLLARILRFIGYKDYLIDGPGPKRYALIHGDIPIDKRQEITAVWNDSKNKEGQLITHLLFTVTASEGFDFKRTKKQRILEHFFHMSTTEQVKARSNRFDSHSDLEESKRTIQCFHYLSVIPSNMINKKKSNDGEKNDESISTDLYLFEMAQNRYLMIKQMLNIYNRVSVHCLKDCKICSPNNKLLYQKDIKEDMVYPDPCVPPKETEKEVKEFIFDNEKYCYDKELHIIKFNKSLNKYTYLDLNDPIYHLLYKKITEIENK